MAAEEIRETKNRIAYTVMIVRDFGEAHHLTPRQAHYFLLNNLDTELYLRGSLNNYHYLRRELDYGKP